MMTLYRTETIPDHARGLRYVAGSLKAWLPPGRHTIWFPGTGDHIEQVNLSDRVAPLTPELDAVIPDEAALRITVPQHALGLLTVDGVADRILRPGRHLVWTGRGEVRVQVVSTEPLRAIVPEAFVPLVPAELLRTVLVAPHARVLLYVDGEQAAVLEPGRHLLWAEGRTIIPVQYDLREQLVTLTGQEVMTADKVTLRLSLILQYTLSDVEQVASRLRNVTESLYAAVQLAARQLVAGKTLDQLLEDRHVLEDQLLTPVAEEATSWGVKVHRVSIKDVILPGEMRTLLNQVIQAEKQAAANVILRREETAATRSLANTAKILASNPTLMRLKELEAMRELASEVDSVTLFAGVDPASLPSLTG